MIGPPIRSLWRFTTEKRKTEEVLSGLAGYTVSFDGEKLFYMRGDSWFIAPVAELKTDAPDAPQGKPVNNGDMMATLDPRAEWQQMYRETWHIERDFFTIRTCMDLTSRRSKRNTSPIWMGWPRETNLRISRRNAG